jgi:beta-glucosidase
MQRRDFLKASALAALGVAIMPSWAWATEEASLGASAFGPGFAWGTATSAFQIEGAWNEDGKGPSIWDDYMHRKRMPGGANGDVTIDHYHRYAEDVALMQQFGLPNYRFSIAWPRVLPAGTGPLNQKGLDFYKRLVEKLLHAGIQPWITLYHWDLPLALGQGGGWANRTTLDRFGEYVDLMTRHLGNEVKHWIILNEPNVTSILGYLYGYHPPRMKGKANFLPAMHHLTLAQSVGARIVRSNVPNAVVGSTFSNSPIDPLKDTEAHREAARRGNVFYNRLHLEPLLGLGYPTDHMPELSEVEKHMLAGDEQLLPYELDFVGIQSYSRFVFRSFPLMPFLHSIPSLPGWRGAPAMAARYLEIYPEALYRITKQIAAYKGVKSIIITENGSCFEDVLVDGRVHDVQRTKYMEDSLRGLICAKNEGAPVSGYFAWSWMDNLEWRDGYGPRFGLVHVDYATRKRTPKDSAYWYRDFLRR